MQHRTRLQSVASRWRPCALGSFFKGTQALDPSEALKEDATARLRCAKECMFRLEYGRMAETVLHCLA